MTPHEQPDGPKARFEIGEFVELKGLVFKVVLVDVFSGKIALKFAPEKASTIKLASS